MYQLKKSKKEDYDFIYELGKLVNKERVIKTYGSWDEDFQKEYFKKKFDVNKIKLITFNNQNIGMLETEKTKNNIHIEEIQLLPEYQGKGIGTKVLQDIIEDAKQKKVNLDLRVMKINPAKKLYERLGFVIVGETETHYLMNMINKK